MKRITLLTLLLCATIATLWAQDRSKDPVVLKGQDVACMRGKSPSQIVAFAYNNGWQQIPMQIDEVVMRDIASAYGPNDCIDRSSENVEWMVPYYADTSTDIGPDNDASFDNNDELVFMAKDAGSRAPNNGCPNGVVSSSKCELTVRDPLNNSIWGYVYLFQQNGGLNQSAGRNYVTYNFTYQNNYRSAYDVCVFNGTNNNTENSKVTTSEYEIQFSQRWVEDVLRIKAGNANGTDILDRHQIFINASACNRNEQVFSDGKGPIVTAIDGPVRAIRSVMGAKSGTFTEETIKFTQYRADYTIFYRLHTANGYTDVFDFNSSAQGMKYYNNRTPNGVTIDGNRDNINTDNVSEWELITGQQGSLVTTFEYETDITLGSIADFNAGRRQGAVSGYYSDLGAGAEFACTGDMRSYGSCGFSLDTKECTDRRATFSDYPECQPQFVKRFTEYRTHYYLAPNTTTNQAAQYGRFGRNPMTASAQSSNCSGGGNNPTCNDGIQNGDETGVDCGGSSCPACPVEPTCDDGIQNGDETGVDCGGSSCPACPVEPTCDDGIQNGDETGVDCGGSSCPACPVEPTCDDGIQNGDETGVDCGGSSCPACPVEPTCNDGIQNGDETGVDCGSSSCPACPDPADCTVPTNLSVTNNNGSSATLNWSAVSSATSYMVELRPVGARNWRNRSTTSTSLVASPLRDGRSYEWRVKAVCGSEESAFSPAQTFIAGDDDDPIEPTCSDGVQNGNEIGIDCGGDCPPCDDPLGCEAPVGLVASNITTNQALLSWNAVEGATRYTINVRPVGTTNWSQGKTKGTSATARPLNAGTTYEWRVQTNCGSELSPWSEVKTFTTAGAFNNLGSRSEELLLEERFAVSVYPSPADAVVQITANQQMEAIEVFNLQGQLLNAVSVSSDQHTLPIEFLQTGTYILRIRTANSTETIKLVKQ